MNSTLSTESPDLRTYRGSASSYQDIATRGTERLGLAIQYAVHPKGAGAFLVRFVAWSPNGTLSPFTHFNVREKAEFLNTPGGNVPLLESGKVDKQQVFNGVRLDKVAFPAFTSAPYIWALGPIGDSLHLWEQLAAWITTQVEMEGFTVVPGLADKVRDMILPPFVGEVALALEFPVIEKKPFSKKSGPTGVVKPEPLDIKDDQDDEEDGDDDEPWLN
jgi:hypothetical protein